MGDDIPNIDNLHKEKHVKENTKHEMFGLVLKRCVDKIVHTNRFTDKTFVFFEVPQVLLGYPTYDMKQCIMFLMHKLREKGYYIIFIDPFYLYIDWGTATNTAKATSHSGEKPYLSSQARRILEQLPKTANVEIVYADKSVKRRK